MKDTAKRISWISLAFMSFSMVWGFKNVINGFSEYGGLQVVFSWIIVFAIYFVPYALMVGELGSTFKNANGGISSWIRSTTHSARLAYYAGWIYWVVQLPLLAQKPTATLVAFSWVVFQDSRISDMNTVALQIVCLVVFVVALLVASRGIRAIKFLATLAGSAMFIMSILYILLMFAAPVITQAPLMKIDWSWDTFVPKFDLNFLTGLSILVFAVGGCEIIAPYVNRMKNPSKDFSKGMIALAVMVAACAILGTISMGMMFDVNNLSSDLMTNGGYYAFQKLGSYYHVGDFLMEMYAITDCISQFSVMVLCIDAPLAILISSADETFIPRAFFKKNKYGTYKNGHKLVFAVVAVLIILPSFGIQDVDILVRWLIKINSICMPICFIWIFVSYIVLKKSCENIPREYYFVKNKKLGMLIGIWCTTVTLIACIFGIFTDDIFQLILNIAIPVILFALGAVMPMIAKRQLKKERLDTKLDTGHIQ